MSVINVDTTKLKDCGNDMINLTIELREQIDGLFTALENIENTCWTGNSAKQFVQNVKTEKLQYFKFRNELYKEGRLLVNSANLLESKIENLKKG